MKKKVSLLLAITLLTGSIFVLSGCEKNDKKKEKKKDAVSNLKPFNKE